jgi:hypothetical protein
MSLHTTPVSRCLDKKLVLFGFEIPDLLAIFFVLSVLNYLLGWTGHRFFFVWCPSIALALTLRLGKRGKPENYLIHWLKFKLMPRYRAAFHEPSRYAAPPRIQTFASTANMKWRAPQ